MNTKPLLAQLPVKSWATALSTYGKLALLFGGLYLGMSVGDHLHDTTVGLLIFVLALFLSDWFFPQPGQVCISTEYFEVNAHKILLDEILWFKKTRFTLTVTDHSGDEVSFRPYYYENHAVERLISLLEKHTSLEHPRKVKTRVSSSWWGHLFDKLFFVSAVFLALSFLGHLLMGGGPVSLDWGTISLFSLLGCIICFFLRANPLLFCHSHLEIGDRKVQWNEIARVSTSLGFVCITDCWGCFYYFNPLNYDPVAVAHLRRLLQESVPPQGGVGESPEVRI